MTSFSTPAILLRRVDFGDYDLILSLFTLHEGKVSLIAKSAKKSFKRFSGVLELFSVLHAVWSTGKRKGIPVLQEASLVEPFFNIRSDVRKTAYAGYWAELINEWLEEGVAQAELFQLFVYVLKQLDHGRTEAAVLSILFQIRLMSMSGFSPNLSCCCICRTEMEKMEENRIIFDFGRGGLICNRCDSGGGKRSALSKGTIKQLLWMEKGELSMAERIRFAPKALQEALIVLEEFVPYHLGKKPRSLKVLRQVRG